jgi:hypothetical protein
MKKLAIALLVFAATAANAQHFHNHYHGGGYRGGWMGPAIIGGMIGYELSRPTIIVQQPSVIVQQPQIMSVPSPAPYGYHWTQMVDPMCNCYKLVLEQN